VRPIILLAEKKFAYSMNLGSHLTCESLEKNALFEKIVETCDPSISEIFTFYRKKTTAQRNMSTNLNLHLQNVMMTPRKHWKLLMLLVF